MVQRGMMPYGSDNTRQFMEGDTRVIERTIVTPQTRVQRTVIRPERKIVGHKTVATVQNVEVKNPSTMKMKTEYAEPYVKRAGYTTHAGMAGSSKTKIIRKGEVMEMGGTRTVAMSMPAVTTQVTRMQTIAAPVMTSQVTRMQTTNAVSNQLLGRGYTRIDTWKHCGDVKERSSHRG